MEVRFKIFRFAPESDEEAYYRTYTVAAKPEERILDCLNRPPAASPPRLKDAVQRGLARVMCRRATL